MTLQHLQRGKWMDEFTQLQFTGESLFAIENNR
jgi:hypothetical protein